MSQIPPYPDQIVNGTIPDANAVMRDYEHVRTFLNGKNLGADNIEDGSITASLIADGAVLLDEPGSVTGDNIADGSITADKLAPGAGGVSGSHRADASSGVSPINVAAQGVPGAVITPEAGVWVVLAQASYSALGTSLSVCELRIVNDANGGNVAPIQGWQIPRAGDDDSPWYNGSGFVTTVSGPRSFDGNTTLGLRVQTDRGWINGNVQCNKDGTFISGWRVG